MQQLGLPLVGLFEGSIHVLVLLEAVVVVACMGRLGNCLAVGLLDTLLQLAERGEGRGGGAVVSVVTPSQVVLLAERAEAFVEAAAFDAVLKFLIFVVVVAAGVGAAVVGVVENGGLAEDFAVVVENDVVAGRGGGRVAGD